MHDMKQGKTLTGEELAARLREAGLRVTANRVAILDAVTRHWAHPAAEEIWEGLRPGFPSLSLSTVYQTLETFIRAGLCVRMRGGDGRLRVDGTIHAGAHDHAICRVCGTIYDVPRPAEGMPAPAALPEGLQLQAVRLEYEVLCRDCSSEPPTEPPTEPRSKR